MAASSYPVNHPLAVKLWAKKLFQEALKETWFSNFIGEDKGSLIVKKTELQKSAGDRIRMGLRMQLTGAGIGGDGTLEGQEEALVTYNDDILIDQLRHAVRSSGKMSEQRVTFDHREEAKDGLRDWVKDRMDTAFFNQLGGYTTQSDTKYTGSNATLAPSTGRTIVGGGDPLKVLEASLSATSTFYLKLSDLDRASVIAKTATPLIRPLRVNGKDMYACFLHPNQVYQLRRDTATTGNWFDLQKSALSGGVYKDNPLFTGALGIYNNTILYEAVRVPNTVSGQGGDQSVYRRAIFCGAQAGAIAFGAGGGESSMNWKEESFDYDNQLGVAAGMIWGLKKLQFNSTDFATIVISSYAPNVT